MYMVHYQSLTCHSLGLHCECAILPPMVLVFIADFWCHPFRLLHVLMVWLWSNLCPWDHRYHIGFRFSLYHFLPTSAFSCVVYLTTIFLIPVPCWMRLEIMLDWVIKYTYRDFLDLVNVLFEEIIWSTTSLSEESARDKFSSTEGKSSCSLE